MNLLATIFGVQSQKNLITSASSLKYTLSLQFLKIEKKQHNEIRLNTQLITRPYRFWIIQIKQHREKMAQKYVEMYANTLITVPSSDDEHDSPKLSVRKTPRLEDIAILISSADNSDRESGDTTQKKITGKSPAESIVNAALKKLGINEKASPRAKQRPKKHHTSSTSNRIQPYGAHSSSNKPFEQIPHTYKYISKLLNHSRGITIAIEGNIAIGKSTLLKRLQLLGPVHITTIREPLEQWTKNGHINLLERSYENPEKWSFILQSLVMTNLLQNHIVSKQTKIMERSLGSTYNVFLQMHHINQTMDHGAILALQEWYHTANDLYATTPDLIIYLRASPELAMKRLKIRDRKEEKHISYKYLTQIHSLYDKWLLNEETRVKVIPINADQTTEEMLKDINIQLAYFDLQSKL